MIRNLNQKIVKENVTIDMSKFPKGTQFNVKQIRGCVSIENVETGDFSCFKNLQKVIGYFDCDNNDLTSLKGAPKHVGGGFDCGFNNLTSLKGAPKYVDGYFDCCDNNLTSLEGAPKYVGGNFWCRDQKLGIKFTEQDVKKVSDVKGAIYT